MSHYDSPNKSFINSEKLSELYVRDTANGEVAKLRAMSKVQVQLKEQDELIKKYKTIRCIIYKQNRSSTQIEAS